jgi:cell division protein FtsN
MGGVALLLVVVLTGGLYWLRPVDSVARADLALPRPRQDAQPFEYVATPGVSVAPEAAPHAAPAPAVAVAAPAEDAAATSQQLPVHQPRPRVTLDTQAPASPAAAPEVRAIATTSARSGAAPAPAAVAAAPAVATPAAEVKRSVPLAKLAPTSPLHEFWVQVGSFASRTRATALEQRLSDQGIVSRVTTRSTDTEVFFRVRVGPYGSRDEAQKFLAWVQHVDGMDGSYISEVRNARG